MDGDGEGQKEWQAGIFEWDVRLRVGHPSAEYAKPCTVLVLYLLLALKDSNHAPHATA